MRTPLDRITTAFLVTSVVATVALGGAVVYELGRGDRTQLVDVAAGGHAADAGTGEIFADGSDATAAAVNLDPTVPAPVAVPAPPVVPVWAAGPEVVVLVAPTVPRRVVLVVAAPPDAAVAAAVVAVASLPSAKISLVPASATWPPAATSTSLVLPPRPSS